MTASWILKQCMEYFVTSPLALCQVWSALWLHLEFEAVHGVLCDQPLGTVPSVECFMTASWNLMQCMEYFVASPLALCQVWSALWLHLEFEAVHGVLCDQPLGTVPSVECFMTASWNLIQYMEYFVTSPLALCQLWSALWLHLEFEAVHGVLCDQPLGTVPSVECFMTASWNLIQLLEYFVTSPLALCQVWSALWLHLEIWGSAWSTLWPAPWHCAKCGVLYDCIFNFEAVYGVLCDQPLGTVPSVECFMTTSWIWGSAWSTLWPAPWHCAKCGVLYDCILKFDSVHGVLCDQPLGTKPSVECFMTASWNLIQCMECFVTSPLALSQVWSALWLHLEFWGSAWSA